MLPAAQPVAERLGFNLTCCYRRGAGPQRDSLANIMPARAALAPIGMRC